MAKNLSISGEAAKAFNSQFAPSAESVRATVEMIGQNIELMNVDPKVSKDGSRHYNLITYVSDSKETITFDGIFTQAILLEDTAELPADSLHGDHAIYSSNDVTKIGKRVGEVLRNTESEEIDFSMIENFKIVGLSSFDREGFNENVAIRLDNYIETEAAKKALDKSYVTGAELVEFCGGAPTLKQGVDVNDVSLWNTSLVIQRG